MTRTRRLTGVVACLFGVWSQFACGEPKYPTAPSSAISGEWQGIVDSPTDGPGTITLQLVQSDSNVTGTLRLLQGGLSTTQGELTGTLSGSPSPTMSYTVTYVYGLNCQGTFAGTAGVNGRQMIGTYRGRDCAHDFVGTLQIVKND